MWRRHARSTLPENFKNTRPGCLLWSPCCPLGLIPMDRAVPVAPLTAPDNDQTLCFCEFNFFRVHMRPCSTFLLQQRLIMGQLKPKHECDNSPKHDRLAMDRSHHCDGGGAAQEAHVVSAPRGETGQTESAGLITPGGVMEGFREHVIWGNSP